MEDTKNNFDPRGDIGVVGPKGEPGLDATQVDYVQAINELRANTVKREQYDKLKEENSRLLKSIINGDTIDVANTEEVDIHQIRQQLFTPDNDMSSLEYITKALKLRNALIEKGEPDPFLPVGKNITPTDEDINTAERVAEVFADCVEYAQGDPTAFTAELMRRTVDVAPMSGRRR